ncbi:MAG: hypothetical protein EP343_30805 [Deltaproteobacteria bacterium]|nr:MAG: hypothetical protein EP343_30805 [Deltaproteobacteria bacterium]
MVRIGLVLLSASLLLQVGCHSAKVPGTYKMDREYMKSLANKNRFPPKKARIWKRLMNRMSMTFMLAEDGKLEFDASLQGVASTKGKSVGYWRKEGDRLKLVITRLASGKKVRQVTYCDRDGNSMVCVIAKQPLPVRFERQ